MSPAMGCFDSYREGRNVLFHELPFGNFRDAALEKFLYGLCHAYDVVYMSEFMLYNSSNDRRRMVDVEFERREDAQAVCDLYNGTPSVSYTHLTLPTKRIV